MLRTPKLSMRGSGEKPAGAKSNVNMLRFGVPSNSSPRLELSGTAEVIHGFGANFLQHKKGVV